MTHIEDIRNFLNAATVRLRELEEMLEQRSTSVHGWDANAIATACAKEWGLHQGALHSTAQDRPVVQARQAAMFLMAKHTAKARKEIGLFFRPDLNVSTVAYALRCVPSMMEDDNNFAGKIVRAETAYLIAKQNQK